MMDKKLYKINLMVLNLAEMYPKKLTLTKGVFTNNQLFIKEPVLVSHYTKEPAHYIYLNNFKL